MQTNTSAMNLEIYDSNKLNFVELNYTGDNDNFIRCDKESKYLDSVVFNLYAHCFEKAHKIYEYYGPTKFNSRRIIPLRNELIKHKEQLDKFDSKEAFLFFINETFLGREFLEQLERESVAFNTQWSSILEKLKVIADELIALTEMCADEEKILWVAGY